MTINEQKNVYGQIFFDVEKTPKFLCKIDNRDFNKSIKMPQKLNILQKNRGYYKFKVII